MTGLTSAVFLAKAGYDVTIIAAHVPGDSSIEYTSPWAGAHWRTHATPETPVQCDWDVQTYNYWLDQLERERGDHKLPRSGIKLLETREYWDGQVKEELWWAPHVRNFRQLSTYNEPVRSCNDRALAAGAPTVQFACAYDAMCINVPQYLLYLQEKARLLGAKVIKARLPVHDGFEAALSAAEDLVLVHGRPQIDCTVNATGLGAFKLCSDTAMYPIRGQTVLVKGEADNTCSRVGDGYGGYYIPRPGSGTTILGGTKQVDNWDEKVDSETTRKILERNSLILPELRTGDPSVNCGFEVVSVQCGLRPARKGGPRMEKEIVDGKKVVHAYGHAGGGYQNSIGSARLARKLVEESLGSGPAIAKL